MVWGLCPQLLRPAGSWTWKDRQHKSKCMFSYFAAVFIYEWHPEIQALHMQKVFLSMQDPALCAVYSSCDSHPQCSPFCSQGTHNHQELLFLQHRKACHGEGGALCISPYMFYSLWSYNKTNSKALTVT